MPYQLTLSNALLSLRGRIHINDGAGLPRYEARGEFALLSPTWRLMAGETLLGTLRRKILSLRPHYDVTLAGEHFAIVGKLFRWRRHYTVRGGRWDGVVIHGNFWDLRFAIQQGDRVLADAQSKILTLRDTHQVQVHSNDEADERFVALCLVLVMREKEDDEKSRRNLRQRS